MIQNYRHGALVMLADGRVCSMIEERMDNFPIVAESVVAMRASKSGLVLMRTTDDRIIRSSVKMGLSDITPRLMRQLRDGDAGIQDFIVGNGYYVIRTRDQICVISTITGVCRHYKNTKVDLVSFYSGFGYIRTTCNRLIALDMPIYDKSELSRSMLVRHSDAKNIKEIICGLYCAVVIRHDGTAYSHSRAKNPRVTSGTIKESYFKTITLPDGELVFKIVMDGCHTLFIMTSGLCYYEDAREPKLCPEPIEALYGFCVEDAHILGDLAAIKYDGNKVCMINTLYQCTHTKYCVSLLSFFDDKSTASVARVGDHVYFIMDDGSAYQCGIDIITTDPVPDRIRFFDDNPIAIVDRAQTIRSAQNVLVHEP